VSKCMTTLAITLALVGSAQLAAAATKPPTAIVTILEGRATVIRALSEFEAAEGLRLLPNDLLRTEKDTVLRIEYEDETSLELGPETLLQLNHPASKRANRPALYLLAGWLKLGSGHGDAAAGDSFASVGMDVANLSGVIVVRADEAAHAIFEEQGSARWIDRSTRGAQSLTLKAGDFLVAGPNLPPQLEGRPAPQFLEALPRPYRDTLPLRYDRFKSRIVVPKGQVPFSYADVERWLNAEPSVRRQFVVLWHRKADNPAFRASLDRDLPMHPEWDRVLHPERYEPQEQQAGSRTSPAAAPDAPTSVRQAEVETPQAH
jgi:hypothetical protein